MDFIEALKLATNVIRDERELDEIYLYELGSQTRVYLKDCEGSLEFTHDKTLPEQVYLTSFLDKRLQSINLSLSVICSKMWEVRLYKTEHLKATRATLGKTAETFLDYTPVGREEVADV